MISEHEERQKQARKKIGLFGGTFDPPHVAHLLIAEEALETCNLDEIWFIPSYLPPHVQGKTAYAAAEDRAEMVRRAISDNDFFKLKTIEMNRKGPSYTVDTLRELVNLDPNCRFYFILGADMLDDLPTWHCVEELYRLTSFIAFSRPGFPLDPPAGADVLSITMPEIAISSSDIRRRLKAGHSGRYFLTDSVLKYIKERDLYGD